MITLVKPRKRKGLKTVMIQLTLNEQACIQRTLKSKASELRMMASGRTKEEALELRLQGDELDNIADKVKDADE